MNIKMKTMIQIIDLNKKIDKVTNGMFGTQSDKIIACKFKWQAQDIPECWDMI